jgi:hypothetical protein
MDSVAITIGSGWTVAGLLLLGLAVPLARGKVARNALYGIRFPQSFQSDEAWYAINCYGGKRMMAWSIPLIITGIVSFFLPLRSHTGLTLTFGFAPLVFVLIPLVESWRFARRFRSGK